MAVASIVDYLKSRGMDSSFNARKNLASQYGISNYSGTAKQNTSLLKTMQQQSQPKQQPQPASNGQNVTITPVQDSKAGNPASSYLTDYTYSRFQKSDRTQDYADRLDELENNRPDEYNSKYQGTIDSIIDSILNREDFKTDDVYESDLYKNYRDQYIQQGQKAMRDTMGAAQAATGGYGSTYASAVGQQAYDSYMSQLSDKSLDIYDRVYQQYLNEGQELYNRLNMVNNQDNIDYGRYRDTVSDYYNDLNYYAGRYDSSYNQDFGEYQTDLSAKQWAEQYAYQKTQDALAQQNWQTQFDYQKEQDALQLDLQRQQLELQRQNAARRSSGGSGGSKKKSSNNAYLTKAKNMLNGTDGNDTHKYQSATVSKYLSKQYGLSKEEAEYITSQASDDLRETSNKNIDKYYKYAQNYADDTGADGDALFEYLNRFYQNGSISKEDADEIFRRMGMD
nr:hypothetical protein [uncultured Enterocloster sp.]